MPDAFALNEARQAIFPQFITNPSKQEYAIHYQRWLDGFTAVEAVEAIWDFLTPF